MPASTMAMTMRMSPQISAPWRMAITPNTARTAARMLKTMGEA